MRVEDRRTSEQPPLELVRNELTNLLRERKRRTTLMRAIDQLRKSYDVQVESGAANRMVQRFAPPPPPSTSLMPAPLTPAERAEVVARWDGGEYTLGEAWDDLSTTPNRPNFAMLPMVERWIENQALERVARIEARKRLLDQDPAIQRIVRERLKSMLVDAYYARAVASSFAEVSDAEVRALHAERRSAFVRLDEVRVLTVLMADSVAANQLVQHGGHTGTLREAAAMAAPNLRVQAQTIRYPTDDPFWTQLQPAFMGMAPREYRIFRHPQGWLVLQVQSKVQGPQTFESLQPGIVQFLRNETLERKREMRLEALSDSLERAVPIRRFPERLARVPWPPPPVGGAAPVASGT
jgi:hypothetical protein